MVPLDGRRLSKALHFAESSGDGNHLPGQKPRSPGPISQGKPSLLPFSVSISHSHILKWWLLCMTICHPSALVLSL